MSLVRRLAEKAARRANIDPYENLFDVNTRERLSKALSPRYIYAKFALLAHERRHPDHPWLTRDAIERLDAFLDPRRHVGFEWGSGNGTAWLARRLLRLTSVEHHEAWHRKIIAKLAKDQIRNVDYRLVEEARYCDPIAEIADGTLDFVLVDGLMRDEAFARSMPKLKPGGWLVFDNVNWYLPSDSRTPHSRSLGQGPVSPRWGEIQRDLAAWACTWTTNGVNDTAIYVKPAAT